MSTIQKMEFLPAVELKRSVSAMGIFDGYGSTFGGDPDSHGDVIAPGAFANSLKEHTARNTRPALLWSHDRSEPIGAWSSVKEDTFGLFVSGKLTLGTRRADEAFALMQDGALSLSIGYRTRKSTWGPNGVRILQDLDVKEISVVAMPSNTAARITSVKSGSIDADEIKSGREFERMLHDIGFSRSFANRMAAHFDAAASRETSPKFDRADFAKKMLAAAERLARKG